MAITWLKGGAGLFVFLTDVERWVALRTAARWEKSLATALQGLGARVYLPLMSRVSVYHEKTRNVQVPLFGGYVFCEEQDFLSRSKSSSAIRAKVAQMLKPPDAERFRSELRDIAEFLTDRKLVQQRLAGGVGDTVRITGGSLEGYLGKVVRVNPSRWVVILEMSFLGARQEVEVDERMVERLERFHRTPT
jgi:transcriptional antiterminator RfaH